MPENNDPEELVECIIINQSLGMSPQKIGSQCAHVTHNFEEQIRALEANDPENKKVKNFHKWKKNPKRIVVVLAKRTNKLKALANMGFACTYDIGKTEVAAGSLTAVNLGIMKRKEASQYIKSI